MHGCTFKFGAILTEMTMLKKNMYLIFWDRRINVIARDASTKSEKRGKEERKMKISNTRLRRWGRENLTVLSYLSICFSVLNAIGKSCLESPRATSRSTRTSS